MTRLAIDGFILCYPRTGLVNYVYNVIFAFYKRGGYDLTVMLGSPNFNDPVIGSFIPSTVRMQIIEEVEPVGSYAKTRHKLQSRKLSVRLPRPEEVDRAVVGQDIYHATDWYHYPASKARVNVMTYADLTTTLFPQFHERTNIVKERRKADAAKRFDRIVAISQSTKKDLVEQFRLPPEQVVVSYPGVDPIYDRSVYQDRRVLLTKYKINPDKRYILSVCTIEPRKNIIGMLEAFRVLCDMHHEYEDLTLVLCGFPGWRNDALKNYMKDYKRADNIVFTGFADLADMPSLYAHAELFVYLSFYEGLGMPIIEAMKSGCPVVCSNTSSMPEVVGACGELVSPYSAEEAAHAMRRILDDVSYGNRLRFSGYERGLLFDWGKHVDDLAGIYSSI